MVTKNLQYYLKLPYRMEIVKSEDGSYFAEIPDLPGCYAQGETIQQVEEAIQDAKRLWIETQLEDNRPIPEPEVITGYSGRILTRIPRKLHKRLSDLARKEGVSLNQYIVYLLSIGCGQVEGQNQLTVHLAERLQAMEQAVREKLTAQQTSSGVSGWAYQIGRVFVNDATQNVMLGVVSSNPENFGDLTNNFASRLITGKEELNVLEEEKPRSITSF